MFKIVFEALMVFYLLCSCGYIIYRHKLYYHFSTVDHNILYRSGMLSMAGLCAISQKYQIRTIVNLQSIGEEIMHRSWFDWQKQYCKEHNINLVRLPIKPNHQPSIDQINKFLKICSNSANQPVLVHCKKGVVRTGMMVAVYLRNRCETDNKRILKNLPAFGHDFQSERYRKFRQFILYYQPMEKS